MRVGSGSRNLLMKLCVSWDLEIPDQPNLAENSRALACNAAGILLFHVYEIHVKHNVFNINMMSGKEMSSLVWRSISNYRGAHDATALPTIVKAESMYAPSFSYSTRYLVLRVIVINKSICNMLGLDQANPSQLKRINLLDSARVPLQLAIS